MFRTDLLPIIRSLVTVFTAFGICHTNYVDCLLPIAATNTVSRLLMMDSKCPKHVESYIKIKLINSTSCWLLLYEYDTMDGPQNVQIYN